MQPANNSWQYAEDGLVIGSSLTAPDSGMHYLPVMNLSDASCTLPAGRGIGDIYHATFLAQTCKIPCCLIGIRMMMNYHNSEDDELMLDVWHTTTLALRAKGTGPAPTFAWTQTWTRKSYPDI